MKYSISSPLQRIIPIVVAICLLVPVVHSQERIVGGDDAVPGAYPWMCALVRGGSSDLYQGQFCAGSLIHESWVVTAAHCVDNLSPSGLDVWVGIHDLDNPGSAVQRDVKAIYVHPNYDRVRGDLVNDIAFLLLASPVTTITPVAYATSPSAVSTNDVVRAIGWGDTEGNPRYPSILQEVDLIIRSISSARNSLGTNILDSRHLAASASGRDTCQGDSGGPLIEMGAGPLGSPLLVGITSYGIGCADGFPGIYANVGNYGSLINAFLSQPTTGDPDVAVSGSGIPIVNGARGVSRANGTKFRGKVRGGKRKGKTFAVSNVASSIPMTVSVRAKGRGFSIKRSPSFVFGGGTGYFRLEFRAPRRTKRNRGRVLVWTNDPSSPLHTFRVQAKSKQKRRRVPSFFGL